MDLDCEARCPARALVVFTHPPFTPGGQPADLQLCGHHANQHEVALIVDGWNVAVDQRQELRYAEARLAAVEDSRPGRPRR